MNTRHELITAQELAGLEEIDRLLDEANTHAFTDPDTMPKSSEGALTISFGTHYDRDPEMPRTPVSVTIYAYTLGPSRQHHFDTVEEALEAVRQWHGDEMGHETEYEYDQRMM